MRRCHHRQSFLASSSCPPGVPVAASMDVATRRRSWTEKGSDGVLSPAPAQADAVAGPAGGCGRLCCPLRAWIQDGKATVFISGADRVPLHQGHPDLFLCRQYLKPS